MSKSGFVRTTTLIQCAGLGIVLSVIFCIYMWGSISTKNSGATTKAYSSIQQLKDFGQGVHYFSQTRDEFGVELALFLENHTNLEVSAIAGEVSRKNEMGPYQGDYGATVGYFVTFREKK